jgi:exopolysaccharide production protein ExoZ
MKIWSLQALRFWAALGVCLYHACQIAKVAGFSSFLPGPLALAGQCGVDVFFVLSGFIIAKTAAGLSPGAFAIKRALRILPLWYLTTVPLLAYLGATGRGNWHLTLATLALWPASDMMTAPLSIGWTLCFEALFYAVVTLILWRRHTAWVALAIFTVASVIRVGAVLEFIGNPMIMEFLFGVALSRAPVCKPAAYLIPICILVIVIMAPLLPDLTALQLLRGQYAWSRVLLFGVPATAIVWGVLQFDLSPGFLTELGDASYALYLLHPMLLMGGYMLLRPFPWISSGVALAGVVSAVVVVTWWFHVLFERSLLAFIKRATQRPAVVRIA